MKIGLCVANPIANPFGSHVQLCKDNEYTVKLICMSGTGGGEADEPQFNPAQRLTLSIKIYLI